MNTAKIIQSNNTGCLFMMNGQYEQAITLFRNAVRINKEVLNQSRRLNLPPPLAPHEVLFEFRETNRPMATSGNKNKEPLDGNTFISRGVMVIVQSNPLDLSVLNLCKLAIITIYNLAAANHLSGLQERDMKKLKHALEYYEVAYKLQCQEPLSSTSNNRHSHVLSILNNVGAIYRVLNDHEKSNVFFRHLLSKLSFLKDTGGHVDENLDRWNGMWGNILLLVNYV